MDPIATILTVASIHFMAVISPGPDFAIIVKNSLNNSRKYATLTALGIACGLMTHTAYCILGLSVLMTTSQLAFSILKYFGAMYLIYLGIKSFRSKQQTKLDVLSQINKKPVKPLGGFIEGFVCNALNVKAMLFMLFLFSLLITDTTPQWLKYTVVLEMFVVTFIWFTTIATLISIPKFKNKLLKFQNEINKFLGLALIALGLFVLV